MANLSFMNQCDLFGSDVLLGQLLEPDDLCFVIKEEISPLIKDSDFQDMYKDGGRPPVSPRILILVLMMQFLEGLSDRAAVRNLKFRLDWKIAFGLPVDFPSIHSTTLSYFRERLITSSKAAYVFDKVIEHLSGLGLIKAKGKQRIDSTHIIGFVRELTRMELLHETLRLFCLDVEAFKSKMDLTLLTFHERYVDKVSTYRMTEAEKKMAIDQAGLAMKSFIAWGCSEQVVNDLGEAQSFRTLKAVFAQNFTDAGVEPELIKAQGF